MPTQINSLEAKQYLAKQRNAARTTVKDAKNGQAKRSLTHIYVVEELLPAASMWHIEPTSRPFENRKDAVARKEWLAKEFPWANFRIRTGVLSWMWPLRKVRGEHPEPAKGDGE